MAYSRWGTSDWYVYPSTEGVIECDWTGGKYLQWTPYEEYADFKKKVLRECPKEAAEALFDILDNNMFDIIENLHSEIFKEPEETLKDMLKEHGAVSIEVDDNRRFVIGVKGQFRSGDTLYEVLSKLGEIKFDAYKKDIEEKLRKCFWGQCGDTWKKIIYHPFRPCVSGEVKIEHCYISFKCYDRDQNCIFDGLAKTLEELEANYEKAANDPERPLYKYLHKDDAE